MGAPSAVLDPAVLELSGARGAWSPRRPVGIPLRDAVGAAAQALRRALAALRRAPATVGLVALMLGGVAVMRWGVTNPGAVAEWASTNVVNLHEHPVSAMVASAFLGSAGVSLLLLGALTAAAATLERRVGALRMIAVVATGHVVASLITEGAVRMAIITGHEHPTAAWQLDVGISYVAFTAVGAALTFVPRGWRSYAIAGAGTYVAVQLAVGWNMTAWGHVLSFLIGMLFWPYLRPAPDTSPGRRVAAYGLAALLIVGVLTAYAPLDGLTGSGVHAPVGAAAVR